ncbi:MAG TPA: ABC transporter permease [Flavitalea sp.]|nr:ABC transporter permease [Flavitalea sp.]
MLRNYLKVALRNLSKNPSSTLINVIGLGTGLVCFILIFLFVKDELSYDRFHKAPEQVFRVVKDFVNDDKSRIPDATTPPALAPAMQKDLPEVAQVTRLFPSWGARYLFKVGDKKMNEQGVMRVDSNFFEVFTFPFLKGNKQSAFAQARSIILTAKSAKKYFGDDDPIGKTITVDAGGGTDYPVIVTAVLKDVPLNSHFSFDFLIPLKFGNVDLSTDWGWYNFYTYVRLKPGVNPKSFESKLQPLFKKYQPDNTNIFYTQALTDIHLDSRLKWELGNNGDRSYVHIMLAIAIFVIIIAGINYINLATARSSKRAKEVGIRKVAGAHRTLLMGQFLCESVIIVFCSLIVSIVAAALILPFFNQLMDKNLTLSAVNHIDTWLMIFAVAMIVGFGAGLYPAFYLARFQPIEVLKSNILSVAKGAFLRKGLVTFQFVISMVMITSIIVISNQLSYIRNKKLGFDKENVLLIHNVGQLQNKTALKEEIKKISSVKSVGGADGLLGGQNWTNSVRAKNQEMESLLNFLDIDYDFLSTMNVNLKEGRNFSKEFGRDSVAIILSETAVKEIGIKQPVIGSQIVWGEEDTTIYYADVIGIVKDFHFSNFHEPIKPFGFVLDSDRNPRINTLFVKMLPGNVDQTINSIEKVWKAHVPDQPIEYSFQDDQISFMHKQESKFQHMFTYLTIVAIVIACLGLFGLASFTAEQRTKEIGIRKVLGASVRGLVSLLSKDFLKLVAIAIAIATPIAWYFMNHWLQDFVYRVSLSWWVFAVAGISAIFIALLTVSYQAIKAAIANPVKSLRTE